VPPVEALPVTRLRHANVVARWNALDAQLAAFVSNLPRPTKARLRFDHTRVLQMFLDYWERLAPHDARNVGLDDAASRLGLDETQRRALAEAGVGDLRGLAGALNAPSEAIALNDADVALVRRLDAMHRRPTGSAAKKSRQRTPRLGEGVAAGLRAAISASLQRSLPIIDRQHTTPVRTPGSRRE
jgi:hypothetical protein